MDSETRETLNMIGEQAILEWVLENMFIGEIITYLREEYSSDAIFGYNMIIDKKLKKKGNF
jgi:hypothetical protein